MALSVAGSMPDGEPVHSVRLRADGLIADILTYGAVLQSLGVESVGRNVVLGFANVADYLTDRSWQGAVVGRCANRITGGRFDLDGRTCQLDRNEGPNTLHGGEHGFGRRLWQLAEHDDRSATLTLTSQDGDHGFPGQIEAQCRYRLEAPSTLVIDFEATTDAPTIVALAQHAYFNLDGHATIDEHRLKVGADHVLDVDAAQLPTGRLLDAAAAGLDFRSPRLLDGEVVDHNYCLARAVRAEPAPAASVEAGGLRLDLATTAPGLQVYTGHKLKHRPFPPRAGLCLEAQPWPDAINHPDFPSPVLRPGATYRQRTAYRFTRAAS
ncbi:MAG: aldose epimerase family protein [Pseudomonadota bacterium]